MNECTIRGFFVGLDKVSVTYPILAALLLLGVVFCIISSFPPSEIGLYALLSLLVEMRELMQSDPSHSITID